MGAANSSLSSSTSTSQKPSGVLDEITTVSERIEGADPIIQRLKALKIVPPLLKSTPLAEGSLKDILVRKPAPNSGTFDSKVLLELFSLSRDWLEEKTRRICQKQEEIENKIELVDALAVKLLQRYNYSKSAMRTTAHNISQVHSLQVDVGELKGRLTEVMSNCDVLCKRISAESDFLIAFLPPTPASEIQLNHIP